MRLITLTVFVLLLGVAGCASGPRLVWSNDAKTRQEFYADQSECEARSMSMQRPRANTGWGPLGNSLGDGLEQGEYDASVSRVYTNCMRGRGWELVPDR